MNEDRLLTLAGALERVPTEVDGKPFAFDMEVFLVEDDCDTAGCAVGVAMITPELVRQGLGRVKTGLSASGRGAYWPTYNRRQSWGAITAFFGISSIQANYLFESDRYVYSDGDFDPTPQEVAARIRRFVQDGGVPSDVGTILDPMTRQPGAAQ